MKQLKNIAKNFFKSPVVVIFMIVAIFTKILLGAVYDVIGITKGTIAVGTLSVLSYLCLILFPRGYAILIPAMLFGVTVSVQVLVGTYVANRLFGDREYAFVYGIITPVLYGGVAIGSPICAAAYDYFGNYQLLWIICAVVFSVAVLLVVAADNQSRLEYRTVLGMKRK